MEKFYFNKNKHVYERKNIPTFKEWCFSQNFEIPEKHTQKENELMESYKKAMKHEFPMYHYMGQEIRVLKIEGEDVVLELYVDEEEGIVHLLDLGVEDTFNIAEVADENFFRHLYKENPSIFKRDSIYDYRYFIYSIDGIVSEWRHGKLWFEKHFDVELKV